MASAGAAATVLRPAAPKPGRRVAQPLIGVAAELGLMEAMERGSASSARSTSRARPGKLARVAEGGDGGGRRRCSR